MHSLSFTTHVPPQLLPRTMCSIVLCTMDQAGLEEAIPVKYKAYFIGIAAISICDDANWNIVAELLSRSCLLFFFCERGYWVVFISLTWQTYGGVLLGDKIYSLHCNLMSCPASFPTFPPTPLPAPYSPPKLLFWHSLCLFCPLPPSCLLLRHCKHLEQLPN